MGRFYTTYLLLICIVPLGCVADQNLNDTGRKDHSPLHKIISGPGETLYNGIVLPAEWPPEIAPGREPMSVPYLQIPPAVIPVDVGRQLFVDDFLVYQTTMERQYHTPEYYSSNPVMRAHYEWERGIAMPFSGGVWWDTDDQKFKMWYFTKGFSEGGVAYAESFDGINWEKPLLDIVKGTSYVLREPRDSVTVWLDHFAQDPQKRFILARTWDMDGWRMAIHTSPDGICWGQPDVLTPSCGDRSTIFYNPFRSKWVFSLRGGVPVAGRSRFYHEADDLIKGSQWIEKDLFHEGNILAPGPKFWCGTDQNDPPMKPYDTATQLYNLDAVAYESLMVGFFSVWHGQFKEERPKPVHVAVGFSRDGFHWHRPLRQPFLPLSEDMADWNWGNVQSVAGGLLVVGDKLYFYCSGRTRNQWATGLAILRRDGFASMNAGNAEQTLVTRPIIFEDGKYLFVNVDTSGGHLVTEILDLCGNVLEEYSHSSCMAIQADSTVQQVVWVGNPGNDISELAGKPIRLRFTMRNGNLYSFWISPDKNGASGGYVSAGGPGFVGPTDTVGIKSLEWRQWRPQ